MIQTAPLELSQGDVPEHPVEQYDVEWRDHFNAQYAATQTNADAFELEPKAIATVVVEDWLEQQFPHQASSYFRLQDQMGPDGWAQRIRGKVFKADETSLPPEVGGGTQPVLALYDAERIDASGTIVPLADGMTVLIRLERQLEPMHVELV